MSGDDLLAALERRRKRVDVEGAEFVRERDPQSSLADISCNDRLATQFTPRHPFQAPAPAARGPSLFGNETVGDESCESGARQQGHDICHWDQLSETLPHAPGTAVDLEQSRGDVNEGTWHDVGVSFCVPRDEASAVSFTDSARETSIAFTEGDARESALNTARDNGPEQSVTFSERTLREADDADCHSPKPEDVYGRGSSLGPLDMSQWTCAGRSSFGIEPGGSSVRSSLDFDQPSSQAQPSTGRPMNAMPPLALGPLSCHNNLETNDQLSQSFSDSLTKTEFSPIEPDFSGTWLAAQAAIDGDSTASPRAVDRQNEPTSRGTGLFGQGALDEVLEPERFSLNPYTSTGFTPRGLGDQLSHDKEPGSAFGSFLTDESKEQVPNSGPEQVFADTIGVSANEGPALTLQETREVDLGGTWLASIGEGTPPQPLQTLDRQVGDPADSKPETKVESQLASQAGSKPDIRPDDNRVSLGILSDNTLLEPPPSLLASASSSGTQPTKGTGGTSPVASGLLDDNQQTPLSHKSTDPLAASFVNCSVSTDSDFLARSDAVASAPGSKLPEPLPVMDPLIMSSSPYFKAPMLKGVSPDASCPTPAKPDGGGSLTHSTGRPTIFPKDRDSVMQAKTDALRADTEALREEIVAVSNGEEVRPAELRRILQDADVLLERFSLREEDLSNLPEWPAAQLRQLRKAEEGLSSWEKTTERAQELVASAEGTVPLAQIVEQLRQLLAAWDLLTVQAKGPVNFGVSLDRRAQLAAPMASVLLDKATELARSTPNTVPARWLERLLLDEAAKMAFQSLGVSLPTPQTMKEIKEDSGQGAVQAFGAGGMKPGARPSAPEKLWHAVVQGDLPVVEAMIQQGGLVSGRTVDAQNHSVLWDAVAFQKEEIALTIFRHFPPDDVVRGVDLAEVHQVRGDTLLHLCCYFTKFTRRTAELFTAIFRSCGSAMYRHQNAQKETFLHLAAQRMNFWVLQFVLQQNLEELYLVVDARGYSPLAYIESRLQKVMGSLQPPVVPICPEDRVPAWSNLCLLRPSKGGLPAQFADIAVQVQDAEAGKLTLYAHRVVLAASSPELHSKFPKAAFGTEGMHALYIDPECCQSAEVVLTALKFLYEGEVRCAFEDHAHLLWQLLCLCVKYQLPNPLKRYASASLLRVLAHKRSAPVVGVLLRASQQVGLQPRDQAYVTRVFLCSPHALAAVEETKRSKTLKAALAIAEQCVIGRD